MPSDERHGGFVLDLEPSYEGEPPEDPYGFRESLSRCSVEELVTAYNAEVSKSGWVRARGFYLSALKDALLATGLDCSAFISPLGISLGRKIRIDGDALVPVE